MAMLSAALALAAAPTSAAQEPVAVEVLLSRQASDTLAFGGSLSTFAPGAFLKKSGPARTIRMIGLEALFRY